MNLSTMNHQQEAMMFEMKNDSYFEWDQSYLNPDQLVYFHDLLISLRADLENTVKKQHNHTDNDMPPIEEIERSTLAVDKEIDIQNRARKWDLIKKIDKALSKIQNGTYGYCEETEEPIGLERLKANPMSEYCLLIQERHEKEPRDFSGTAFLRNRYL